MAMMTVRQLRLILGYLLINNLHIDIYAEASSIMTFKKNTPLKTAA